mmetsp:Transcript_52714/g.146870  ORF Transcript_52714/g.146870 Transcript_52714/m.146870 type:complete len:456 (-) Transcript_52714:597-1964(-)
MPSPVVMQKLLGEIPARHRHRGAARYVAVDQEGAHLPQGAELRQDVLTPRDHLGGVVRCDVRREQLPGACLLDARAHRLHHLGNTLVHLAENLVALRLVVLYEVTTLPEGVARFPEGFRLQAQLGFDDGADHEAAIGHRAAEDAPHVQDAGRRAIEETQVGRREVDVVDFPIFDVAHTLVVPDRQREDRAHHGAPVDDVPVEQHVGVRNFHLFVFRVDIVNQSIDRLCEIVRRAHVHVGARRRFGREVSRCCEIIVACLWFHYVSNEHMLSVRDEVLFHQGKIGVTARLVERPSRDDALLAARRPGRPDERRRRLLLPIERRRLHRRLARVTELFLPSRVDLVGVLLEGQERPLDFFVRLRVLDDAVGEADVAVGTSLPQLPRLLALAARRGTLLRPVLVAERPPACGQDHVGVAQVLEERGQPEGVHAAGNDRRGLLHALPLLVIVRPVGRVFL